MNFLLSEQQLEIQQTVARLLAERYGSLKVHESFDSDESLDAGLWRDLAEMGVTGLHLAEEHGGIGLQLVDLAIVAEALGAGAAAVPMLGHWLVGLALQLAGSDEQKARWLPRIASGEIIATVAFAEEGGWHPHHWTLESAPRLSGCKHSVFGGSNADLLLVGLAGGALALVEGDAEGVSISPMDGIDRTRRMAHVEFANAPAQLLPPAPDVAERLYDAALALLAADAFGGASRCLQMAVEYAKVREQYGVAIGQFQGLKHQLANMAVEVEPARGLYWYAAYTFDHLPGETTATCALAKAHLSERFLQVARDCIEAHGGIGYTWEYDAQIYLKRALFDYAYFDVPAEHRARYADLAYS